MYQSAFEDDSKGGGGLSKEIKELKELLTKQKTKKFRLPFKAKVNKSKVKRGYLTVMVVNENKVVGFTREPIVEGTIKLRDTIHAVEEMDILTYKNKPFIILPKNKLNPFNPCNPTKGENQTYGHKYVMSRMESDTLKVARRAIGGMLIFGAIIAAVIGYYVFFGGGGVV